MLEVTGYFNLTSKWFVYSGVSRVWQAWHVPWAPLWRGAQKLKSLCTVFWTSVLRAIPGT